MSSLEPHASVAERFHTSLLEFIVLAIERFAAGRGMSYYHTFYPAFCWAMRSMMYATRGPDHVPEPREFAQLNHDIWARWYTHQCVPRYVGTLSDEALARFVYAHTFVRATPESCRDESHVRLRVHAGRCEPQPLPVAAANRNCSNYTLGGAVEWRPLDGSHDDTDDGDGGSGRFDVDFEERMARLSMYADEAERNSARDLEARFARLTPVDAPGTARGVAIALPRGGLRRRAWSAASSKPVKRKHGKARRGR